MAGTLIVSNLTTDTDNTFIVRSNTGTTLFSANTTGIDVANSIGATAITNDKILSVANTKISGNIISSQIAPNQTFYGNASFSSTGSLTIPSGTTEQRPTGVNGMIRYNSTTGYTESYANGAWVGFASGTYLATYMLVAGGGAGGSSSQAGNNGDGGGGAGGLVTGSFTFIPSATYTVTIGAAGAVAPGNRGGSGGNTTAPFSPVSAVGGGGGGTSFTPQGAGAGNPGGSGGGGAGSGPLAGGSGTPGQGNPGGNGVNDAPTYGGGGGGGAGATGGNATTPASGAGGIGLTNSISGTSTYYAGGGGGGSYAPTGAGAGGTGGGGAGGNYATTGTSGTTNLGGGGGGSSSTGTGGAGGSGIVIISYPGLQRGSGGTVTTVSGQTIHTFTTSGTYTG
jgi:hypothetical protein